MTLIARLLSYKCLSQYCGCVPVHEFYPWKLKSGFQSLKVSCCRKDIVMLLTAFSLRSSRSDGILWLRF
jgi:hypothetical protein